MFLEIYLIYKNRILEMRYIVTKAIIVKFDYNKVFDIIKKELSK